VVVLSILVINTIVSFGPIIFLKIGENKVGQYDALILPRHTRFDNNFDSFENIKGNYLNYTQVDRVTQDAYNLSPRKVFGSTFIYTEKQTGKISTNFFKESDHSLGSLVLIDTEREKEIGVGTNYPFDAMSQGECSISVE
jgi:hypothetical protein